MDKYVLVRELGRGSYGSAMLVRVASDPGQLLVVKQVSIGHLSAKQRASTEKEAHLLSRMHHSNIVSYVESFTEKNNLYIVMDYADGGDLAAAIEARRKAQKPFEEEEAMRIFVQICLALRHIHARRILHRDLKSGNVFLTRNGVVKLGDFGIAKLLDSSGAQAATQIGTPYYLSPEICQDRPYGKASDIWSMGIVLYELLALKVPFSASNLPVLASKIVLSDPPPLPSTCSAECKALAFSLLSKDPEKRPSINQILRGDYLRKHISRLLSHTIRTGTGGAESLTFADKGEMDAAVLAVKASISGIPPRFVQHPAPQRMPSPADGEMGEVKVVLDARAGRSQKRVENSGANPFSRQSRNRSHVKNISENVQPSRQIHNSNSRVRDAAGPHYQDGDGDQDPRRDAVTREFLERQRAVAAIKQKCEEERWGPRKVSMPIREGLAGPVARKESLPARGEERAAIVRAKGARARQEEQAKRDQEIWAWHEQVREEKRRHFQALEARQALLAAQGSGEGKEQVKDDGDKDGSGEREVDVPSTSDAWEESAGGGATVKRMEARWQRREFANEIEIPSPSAASEPSTTRRSLPKQRRRRWSEGHDELDDGTKIQEDHDDSKPSSDPTEASEVPVSTEEQRHTAVREQAKAAVRALKERRRWRLERKQSDSSVMRRASGLTSSVVPHADQNSLSLVAEIDEQEELGSPNAPFCDANNALEAFIRKQGAHRGSATGDGNEEEDDDDVSGMQEVLAAFLVDEDEDERGEDD